MSMFGDLADIRKAVSEFQYAKDIFGQIMKAPIHIPNAADRQAIEEATALFKAAYEHHATLEMYLGHLVDSKTPAADLVHLLAAAQDQKTELGSYVARIEKLVGTEYALVTKALEDAQAAKAKK